MKADGCGCPFFFTSISTHVIVIILMAVAFLLDNKTAIIVSLEGLVGLVEIIGHQQCIFRFRSKKSAKPARITPEINNTPAETIDRLYVQL